MTDQSKTKKQLISEIQAIRKENEGLRRADTRRKQSAKALRRSEKRLRLTFDQSPIGAALVGPKNEFLSVNSQFCNFLGYSQQEMTSLSVLDITCPDNRDTSQAMMEDLLDGKADQIQQHEKRYLRKDGAIIWGRVSVRPLKDRHGRILFRLAMVEDITEQKKAEEALRRSEREKAIILDAMSEYVIFQDNDHKVLWANRAAVDTTKNAMSELIGRRCHEIWGSSEKECEGCPVINVIKTKKFQEAMVFTLGRRVRLIRASPVEGPDGEVIGAVSVSLDITKQKRAEKEREKLIAQLQKALAEVKKLSGLLPICASCKKIRNDQGYWEQIETYIGSRSEADFSHGICPECKKKLYPELKNTGWD